MAAAKLSTFIRRLTRGMTAQTLDNQSDRQLVERLLAGQDEAAFEAIVRRHGPMVYRVCWRVLEQDQDAEDAFQATFLLLAQKLRSVRKQSSLASWLHGVAHRVALGAGRGETRPLTPRPSPPSTGERGESGLSEHVNEDMILMKGAFRRITARPTLSR